MKPAKGCSVVLLGLVGAALLAPVGLALMVWWTRLVFQFFGLGGV